MSGNNSVPYLQLEGIAKSFGSTRANVDISLSLAGGEVRGLAGENGSGKSTLMSVVAGIYTRDAGVMQVKGQPYNPASPLDGNRAGIAMVTQELGLVNALPVGTNIFLGHMQPFTRFGIINTRRVAAAAQQQVAKWGFPPIQPNRLAGDTSVEERKVVEIIRAMTVEPDIVIFDEVTQALSHDNRQRLYNMIAGLKSSGKSVLIITHDLEEMLKITDTISVLRDGMLLETVDSASVTEDELKRKMVGRELGSTYYRVDTEDSKRDEVALCAQGLATADGVTGVDFELHAGEIVGVCGLSDAGIHELGKAVFGLSPLSAGQVRVQLDGKSSPLRNAAEAAERGMAYVPKDRDGEALMIDASIANNLVLPSLKKLAGPLAAIQRRKADALTQTAIQDYSIKCNGARQLMNELSGGNKQKVNFGRWLAKGIRILVVDCPTRGVDVGVKAYIYQSLKQAKQEGVAILLITDELPEAIGMSDRILVMKNGRVVDMFKRGEGFSEEKIIEVMI